LNTFVDLIILFALYRKKDWFSFVSLYYFIFEYNY
jgi:hypothetical protein